MKASPHYRWIAARERTQREREKNRQAVLRELNEVLTKLEKKYTWSALYLFGSATKRGGFGSFLGCSGKLSAIFKHKWVIADQRQS